MRESLLDDGNAATRATDVRGMSMVRRIRPRDAAHTARIEAVRARALDEGALEIGEAVEAGRGRAGDGRSRARGGAGCASSVRAMVSPFSRRRHRIERARGDENGHTLAFTGVPLASERAPRGHSSQAARCWRTR